MKQLLSSDRRRAMNVRIPEDVYWALKNHAQRRDKSMNKVIADLIRENLILTEN